VLTLHKWLAWVAAKWPLQATSSAAWHAAAHISVCWHASWLLQACPCTSGHHADSIVLCCPVRLHLLMGCPGFINLVSPSVRVCVAGWTEAAGYCFASLRWMDAKD